MTDLLKSRLLEACGVAHGFNLRGRGASVGPYRACNLGRAVGDDADHVEANHREFARAVGYAPGRLYETAQVHGRGVKSVRAHEDVACVRALQADALVTGDPGVAIGVRIADCVPVLLFDPGSGAVAAIHAGWRGAVAGVIEAGVDALRQHAQLGEHDLVAAIFPHIARCCFEVGPDVARALRFASPDPSVVDSTRAPPHVDLRALVKAKLIAQGVAPNRVDMVPGCTRCDVRSFFSFRRDGARSGRHVAAIVAPARP